jgi:hypothetical protein
MCFRTLALISERGAALYLIATGLTEEINF